MKKSVFIKGCILGSIVVLTVILVFLLIGHMELYNQYTRVDSVECFLHGDYVEYTGGKDAKIFFDKYSDVSDYVNIAFEHHAGGVVGNYAATYILDLQYIPEQYEKIKSNILVRFTLESELETFSYGGFIVNLIAANEELYNNNYCLICFDDDYNIVRFIFIYDISPKNYDVYSPIGDNTINLKWNNDENDLIFPK